MIGIINGVMVAMLAAHAQPASPDKPSNPPAVQNQTPKKTLAHTNVTAPAAAPRTTVPPAASVKPARDYRQAAVKRSSRSLVFKGLQQGRASWYRWRGGYYAAHRYLPKGTRVKVTNAKSGKSVWVTINDRGPFVKGRVIDLQPAPYAALFGGLRSGTGPVRLEW